MINYVTPEGLATHLGLASPDEHCAPVTNAINAYVATLPWCAPTTEGISPLVAWGATALAARLHRRRNSPGGMETLADGAIAYVARGDSDIARALQVDQYAPPQVG